MTSSTPTATLAHQWLMCKYTGGRDHPSRDEIARLAYRLYEARGRWEGHEIDDWVSAERELTHHYRCQGR